MTDKKRVAILGSTGSIGTQTLEVIRQHPEDFLVEVLTAQNNCDLLIAQALEFNPNAVVIGNEDNYQKVKAALLPHDIKVFAGQKAIAQIVEMETIDVVLTALVGYSGLIPTVNAIKAGKQIALANKETMVVAGEIITALAKENRVNIFPVDSEHSAIFQCLVGEYQNPIEKIILTASGGPFRGKDRAFLETVTLEQALKHPNWDMGAKITIDSASLMNKGLEVIEAKWLFGLKTEQIEVIVHPQSIIHSLVQFEDGSIKAQLGLPDMRIPIQFALSFPYRLKSDFERFDFMNYPQLTFEQPDLKTFRNLQLAFDALAKGGNAPCILNASNEIAVAAFLNKEVGFLEMSDLIADTLAKATFLAHPTLEDYIATDQESREITTQLIKRRK
ncbi:1-deoxy-D-xylulose 5-phosphate reductoisomerase [Algoriphagus alkaliphilus]|uniref:1-deoxy-D-xylulose 5-phosphate reductoisomerase n=1 Tax=Algoriphagus alkaliphilus TaxID=279824 RepID=A0A1G5VTZ7_9BACT|nr:1-deoxy-D-xylulose-5-phosphate reductoisomerase [Algoriphagus alkaliphilus]MBA4298584.1 1-deoxy-D-xylulose-5-phosphate reductoisomerase [Cyclobacterium sp.]SDA49238.1 1-deoxy-D-xylulose 5-phosphate reductoisomerase [Algoriphagus alkaliphilus]